MLLTADAGRREGIPPEGIRSYGRTELAQLYNPCLTPKAAYRKLVGWIDHYPGLAVRLAELGKLPGSRSYTPAQVREIVEALGEP